MITVSQLQRAYRGKRIIHVKDKTYFPNDVVKIEGGEEIVLDTNTHMTFLKEDVDGEYFHMMILNKIGELPLFNDPAIKTIVIANARPEEGGRSDSFLTVVESEKSVTYTFLAGGK